MLGNEHEEATALMEWCEWNQGRLPGLALLFHIQNEGLAAGQVNSKGVRFSLQGEKQRREGKKAGVPDYLLPIAAQGYHGLFIELKGRNGRLRPEQREWLQALERQGYLAIAAFGWEEAARVLEQYLTGKPVASAVTARGVRLVEP